MPVSPNPETARRTNHLRNSRIRGVAGVLAILFATALAGAPTCGQAASSTADPHLDLFLWMIRARSGGAITGPPAPVSQSAFEQMLRVLPAVSIGHGGGPPLASSSQSTAPVLDPSIYGFCYEACKIERAVGSCGQPAPGASHARPSACVRRS